MSKSATVALAVWVSAVGSVGALAYALNRPPTPVSNVAEVLPPTIDIASERPPAPPPANVTEFAPQVIVREPVRPHISHAMAAPQFRELSDMRCSGWENLAQGLATQQVRRCE